MRILHVITSLKRGGAETALYNFLTHATENYTCEHVVAYFYVGPFVETINRLGIKTVNISGRFKMYDPWAYMKLSRLVKEFQPDIIHSALWSANMFARLVAQRYNIPLINDLHGNVMHEGKFRNMLDRISNQIPYKIVAVSNSVKRSYGEAVIDRMWSERKQKAIASQLVVIENGIDADALRSRAQQNPLFRAELGLIESDFVIGSVGRFEPIKSYSVLIKAFALLINKITVVGRLPKLCLVGGGSQDNYLRTLAQELGIAQYVIFTGFRDDAYRMYPLFDCFALSSQSEGLSIALLEAMSFGLPIVTTCDGTHDVIVDGQHGFVVFVDDVDRYTVALENLYNDQPLVKSMQEKNRKLVDEKYSLSRTVDTYFYLYKQLVDVK